MTPQDVVDDPLLNDLNDRQLLAVTASDVSTIVLAGAGSGKTSVLTRRAAYLIREGRVTLDRLAMVTFTNAAAKEMKGRLASLLGPEYGNLKDMWIGTFHGLCNRMLRENYLAAGLPSTFSIMDDDDQLRMCKRILKDMPRVPTDVDAKELKNFINTHKELGIRSHKIETHGEEFAVEFYAAYEAQCAREGTVDFAELLLKVTELLETDDYFLSCYRDKFSHIQVDEFQDTNSIQYKWLRALKGDYASIFAVGDDDQAIYSFRGSNVEIMREFVDEIGEENVVRLEQNYRSTGAILQAANSLIDKNEARLGKNLWTDSGDGNRVRVLGFNNDLDESDYVARSIKKLLDAGTDPEEIAILYRSNHQSRGYETSLMAYGIPYMIHGGTKFYDRMEVRNALAYMRLTSNEVDDSAFDRIINFPPRGLGEKTLEQIQQRARSERASTGASMSLLEASSCIEASPKVVGALGDFVEVLIDLHNAMTTLNLPQYVNYLIERTGLVEFYESKKEEGERQRANNLKELVTAAARFCEESDIPDALSKPADEILAEFMAAATLDSAVDKKKAGEAEGEGQKPKAIKLMTVHAAKGLEFDVIYIGGADESIFPSSKAVEQDGDQEERRLMYVAITRGKRQVSMTTRDSAIIRGEKKDLAPSRFIAEIAEPYKTYGRPPNARQLAQRAAERERALQGSDSTSPFPGARDQEMWGGGSDQEVRRGAKQQPRR